MKNRVSVRRCVAAPSAEAKSYVTWDGRRISNVETVKLRMMEPVRAAERPKRFRFGVSTGGIYPNFHESGWRKWAGFCREAGLNTMTPDLRDLTKRDRQIDILREVGFSWVLPIPPPDAPLYNGYCIGPSAGRPESDRFVTDPGEYARLPEAKRKALDNAVCPSAVYERRPRAATLNPQLTTPSLPRPSCSPEKAYDFPAHIESAACFA